FDLWISRMEEGGGRELLSPTPAATINPPVRAVGSVASLCLRGGVPPRGQVRSSSGSEAPPSIPQRPPPSGHPKCATLEGFRDNSPQSASTIRACRDRQRWRARRALGFPHRRSRR